MEIEAKSTNDEDRLLNKVIPLTSHVVNDSGDSLYQVFWFESTFNEVINRYRRYVSTKYKVCKTVFDGYK